MFGKTFYSFGLPSSSSHWLWRRHERNRASDARLYRPSDLTCREDRRAEPTKWSTRFPHSPLGMLPTLHVLPLLVCTLQPLAASPSMEAACELGMATACRFVSPRVAVIGLQEKQSQRSHWQNRKTKSKKVAFCFPFAWVFRWVSYNITNTWFVQWIAARDNEPSDRANVRKDRATNGDVHAHRKSVFLMYCFAVCFFDTNTTTRVNAP